MILNISTTHKPATDLGFLLHKNPKRLHEFNLNHGKAHVFYPTANDELCEVTLIVFVNPISLVRGKHANDTGWSLGQYVNDRPYAASSFLSTAIADIFGTAMNGRCKNKPELVDHKIPLKANIPVLPSTTGEEGIRKLFEPLGYQVDVKRLPLDEAFPNWGDSRYFKVSLETEKTVQALLSQLYVLIPVLDKNKHYFISKDEVDKLLSKSGEWLVNHPEKEWITNRYLKFQRRLTEEALERLKALEADDTIISEAIEEIQPEQKFEERMSLHEQRLGTVVAFIKKLGIDSVADLGCGEGKLLRRLLEQTSVKRILGMDVSARSLEIAKNRLRLENMAPLKRQRIELILGSLLYRDPRIEGFDVITLVEVIEHLDFPRLKSMERIVFEKSNAHYVIVTTPNIEYNIKFESLQTGRFRHSDHRFEWTRTEFQQWTERIAHQFGYACEISSIGSNDPKVGAPSQLALFAKRKEIV